MPVKEVKPISRRQFNIFIGLGISLFSLILMVNMWIIARVLSFPFVYLFGIMSYPLFLYALAQGVSLMIRSKIIPIRLSLRFIGVIITFISICLLISTFQQPQFASSGYQEIFNIDYYLHEPKFINLFTETYGGGFLGLILFEMLNSIAGPLPYIIGFLVFSVGVCFIFMNAILNLFSISGDRKNKNKAKGPKEKKIKNKNTPPGDPNEITITRDNTSDVIKNASVLDNNDEEEDDTSSPVPNKPIPLDGNNLSNPYSGEISFKNNGIFTPAHFVPGVIPGDTPSTVMNPINQPNTPNEPVDNPAPVIRTEERKEEQLTLDFDNPQPVNENIVTAQPIFEEPTVKNNNVSNSVVTNPTTPVENNQPPKVKKPIKWVPPSPELLEEYEISEALEINQQTAEERTKMINQVFADFNIGAEVDGYVIGPAVTRYNIKYKPNVSVREVEKKITDMSIRLGGVACRFEAVVEGSSYSGLEIPNARVTMVSFKDVYEELPDPKKHPTAIAFGKNVLGKVIYADFNAFPHCLVAGTTGSGKSIFIHSIISTLIMRNSPEMLKLVLVDPKRVEMVKYKDIPHLLCPIINDPHKAKPLLDKLVDEMNARYDLLASGDGFQDIKEYNEYAEEHGLEKIPTIVAILDEFGDLVETCKEIAQPIVFLGQKARACGIHMLIATQSPTSDIITGSIKSNLPTHVALMTANTTQSVTILGEGGAEKLLGKGDMLVQSPLVSRVGLARLQGCYIAGKEITRIAGYLREHYETQYDEKFLNLEEVSTVDGQLAVANGVISSGLENNEEERYQSIKEWVMCQEYTSMSRIQAECSIGFNRARRIFNRLIQEGIVSPTSEGNKGCRVLVHDPSKTIDDNDIPTSEELID